jgi:hypothetical protein
LIVAASGRAKHGSNARHHSDPCTCSDGLRLKSVDEIAVGLDVCLQPALLARWPAAQLLRASGIHRSSSVFVLPGARTNRDSQQSKSLRISLKCSWSGVCSCEARPITLARSRSREAWQFRFVSLAQGSRSGLSTCQRCLRTVCYVCWPSSNVLRPAVWSQRLFKAGGPRQAHPQSPAMGDPGERVADPMATDAGGASTAQFPPDKDS